jgi:hypothetical protein
MGHMKVPKYWKNDKHMKAHNNNKIKEKEKMMI